MKIESVFSRIEHGSLLGDSREQLVRESAANALMRPEFIIPRKIKSELVAHVSLPQGNDDLACAFGFQGADQPFNDCNGAVFTDRAITWPDVFSFAPILKRLVPELGAFIADDISWSLTGRMNGSANEGTDLERIMAMIRKSLDT